MDNQTPALPRKLADSLEQRDAEKVMVRLLSEDLGVCLRSHHLKLPGGGSLQIDGYSEAPSPSIACEAWAHQGEAKPAQKDKVSKDILKLLFVRTLLGEGTRLILLFSDEDASTFLRGQGWRSQLVQAFRIEIVHVKLPQDLQDRIRKAQERQDRYNKSL